MRRTVSDNPFIAAAGSLSIPVTLSAGVAACSGPDDTIADLMKRADKALYQAKRNGRNKVMAEAA